MQRHAYLYYFVANFAPRAMMFGLLLVLTRLMPMDEYGRLVLVVATGELFDMALGAWVRIYALRSCSSAGTLLPRDLGRILVLTSLMTAVSLCSAGAVALSQTGHAVPFALSVMAYLLAFASVRLALIMLQIRRMHVLYATIEILRGCASFAATTIAVSAFGAHYYDASLGLAAATSFAAGIGLVFASRGIARPRFGATGYAAALAFGLPIIAAGLLNHSIGLVDRYIIDGMIGPGAVAIFAAAYSFARQPIDLFLGPLNNYAFPHLVRLYEEDGVGPAGLAQAEILTTSVMVGGAIALGIMLLATPLLTFFLPPDYRREGALVLPWLTAGALFLTIKVFVFDNVFHFARKTWQLPLAMLLPAIIGFAMCIALIPRIGVVGAAIGYAAAGASTCIASAVLTHRIMRMPIPWNRFARIAIALLGASIALVCIRNVVAAHGALLELVIGTSSFCVAYAGLLHLLGISVLRLLDAPWAEATKTKAGTEMVAALPKL